MPNPTLTIRIPEDLKQAVAEAAAATSRSVTSFTEAALYAALHIGPGVISHEAAEGKAELARVNKKVSRARKAT